MNRINCIKWYIINNGNIIKTGSHSLALEIEENGYNDYINSVNIIDTDKKNE